MKLLLSTLLGLILGAAPAVAAVEQCRFIQAKPEREACYQRQEKELAAKRKPEPAADTSTIGIAAADAAGRRGALQEHARHLPGLLSGRPYFLSPPQLPARFSANEARPSDASAVWRRAECIRTSRA